MISSHIRWFEITAPRSGNGPYHIGFVLYPWGRGGKIDATSLCCSSRWSNVAPHNSVPATTNIPIRRNAASPPEKSSPDRILTSPSVILIIEPLVAQSIRHQCSPATQTSALLPDSPPLVHHNRLYPLLLTALPVLALLRLGAFPGYVCLNIAVGLLVDQSRQSQAQRSFVSTEALHLLKLE